MKLKNIGHISLSMGVFLMAVGIVLNYVWVMLFASVFLNAAFMLSIESARLGGY